MINCIGQDKSIFLPQQYTSNDDIVIMKEHENVIIDRATINIKGNLIIVCNDFISQNAKITAKNIHILALGEFRRFGGSIEGAKDVEICVINSAYLGLNTCNEASSKLLLCEEIKRVVCLVN
ncbi:MAG: hypothetical protein K0S74_229 [Chlamydiales bacterium]|jgi:hypothetical protein|nr:hypothetical protein [Chlamydiales bacterium]